MTTRGWSSRFLRSISRYCDMKVGELINLAKGHEDDELTIVKHDKGQLTCHTTVGVKNAQVGFDWTHGQLVLTPEVKLATEQSVIDERVRKTLRNEAERNTRHLQLAARIARMIQGITDEDLRNRIHDVLKQF